MSWTFMQNKTTFKEFSPFPTLTTGGLNEHTWPWRANSTSSSVWQRSNMCHVPSHVSPDTPGRQHCRRRVRSWRWVMCDVWKYNACMLALQSKTKHALYCAELLQPCGIICIIINSSCRNMQVQTHVWTSLGWGYSGHYTNTEKLFSKLQSDNLSVYHHVACWPSTADPHHVGGHSRET